MEMSSLSINSTMKHYKMNKLIKFLLILTVSWLFLIGLRLLLPVWSDRPAEPIYMLLINSLILAIGPALVYIGGDNIKKYTKKKI